MTGCGKLDNNGKVVSGSPLPCGTKLAYGVGKEPKRTVVHLCAQCAQHEPGFYTEGESKNGHPSKG